jgi:glucosamine--fructose-6-phosphate aminotransferase (isomerizing)
LITAGNGSPGAKLAETVVTTDEMDQSWCHTVGYVSPLIAAAAIGASLSGRGLDGSSVADLMTAGASDAGAAELIAAALAKTNRIIVIGSGADRVAARELVLKIEEAAWIPSAMRDLETFLHGHLPATDETTGLVLLLTDRDRGTERVARARQALAAAKVVGVRAAAIVSADVTAALDVALTPAGRIVIPAAASLPAPIASLLGTATALQLLTERIARATGRNPDAIRREDARYLAAAAAAD